ncbi:MAG TPA: choice-of-anchor Q domain-containing protein, partial [Solirubrobacteraceae bacterium]|nr:choice-of-anchor Q domain-containing protein [Solirubrobacteraceae bacterium]
MSTTTYFVAPSGSDAVACSANSSAAPFASIQKAIGCTVDGDVVNLAPSGATPYPGIGTIADNVTIQAQAPANARTVTIDAGKGVLSVSPGAVVTFSGVSLNCVANDCGAPTVTNEGTLKLSASTISGNAGVSSAILNTTPAGSLTPAALSIESSTVSGNSGRVGGAVQSSAGSEATGPLSLTIANSTIAGNFAQSRGGGVSVVNSTAGSSATIVNSTITANSAPSGGGGLYAGSPVVLSNTILAGNTTRSGIAVDCEDKTGANVSDGGAGHNLIGSGSGCPALVGDVHGDQVGVSRTGLLALANNGGGTETIALQSGSPALAGGDPSTCASVPVVDRDQRGEARRSASRGCDVGAYDTAGNGGVVDRTYFVAPSGSDAVACSANSSAAPFASIQKAIGCTVDGDVVNLAPSG